MCRALLQVAGVLGCENFCATPFPLNHHPSHLTSWISRFGVLTSWISLFGVGEWIAGVCDHFCIEVEILSAKH